MRTVLVASLGLSPAVLTETLWAMMHPPEGTAPTVPERVHVLTTARYDAQTGYAGFEATSEQIRARIGMLCAQFGHPAPEVTVEAVADPSGGARRYISDVSTQRENILFAGRITAIVHGYAQDPDLRIHMSLAGGRKSMSSYAHTAMMFFGRVQDELTHVLADPPDLEACGPTFWWPGQPFPASRPDGTDAEGRPRRAPVDVSVGKARVELVNVPFVRLGVLLPEGARIEDADYERLVDFIGFERAGGKVELDLAARMLRAGGEAARLPANECAVLALLAIARAEAWPGEGPDGPGGAGWLRLRDFSVGALDGGRVNAGPAISVLEALLETLRARPQEPDWLREEMDDPEEPVALRGKPLMQRINDYDGRGANPVQPVLSKIATEIAAKVQSPFLRALVTPRSRGPKGSRVWGLDLPPERIVLKNFGPDHLGRNPAAQRRVMP